MRGTKITFLSHIGLRTGFTFTMPSDTVVVLIPGESADFNEQEPQLVVHDDNVLAIALEAVRTVHYDVLHRSTPAPPPIRTENHSTWLRRTAHAID